MFRKVLVLSASAGAGHVRAAQAIEKAFIELGAAEEIIHIDALEYTNKMFRDLYAKAFIDMAAKTPDLLGWFYDQLDKPWKNERRRLAFDKLNTGRLIRLLKKHSPEVVVCTHFLPAEIISWLRAREKLACRQAIIVTDFDVHAMWLTHNFEHYFVALDETREHLEQLGIPSAKLTVSGIPIDPVFALMKEKRAMRRKFGLDPDLTTILISAGGYGVGKMDHLITSLARMEHPAQVVAACGRNEELREQMTELAASLPPGNVTIHAIGFTTEMDEYMTASDIIVGKPGGLTTSEALAKGLVFVVVNPIPGQEERNSDHLLEEGVALRCNNLPTLAYKIDRLLDNPRRLATMQANALRMGRPSAAHDIVNKLLALKEREGWTGHECESTPGPFGPRRGKKKRERKGVKR
jgi:processive 1,2-diacylglycerol beta-glucosyltransferase